MKFFKALFKLTRNFKKEKKVIVTENYSQVEESYSESECNNIIYNKEISDIRDWAMKKMKSLHKKDDLALAAEFDEWILIADDVDELEYLSIENPGWTEDREIDVK